MFVCLSVFTIYHPTATPLIPPGRWTVIQPVFFPLEKINTQKLGVTTLPESASSNAREHENQESASNAWGSRTLRIKWHVVKTQESNSSTTLTSWSRLSLSILQDEHLWLQMPDNKSYELWNFLVKCLGNISSNGDCHYSLTAKKTHFNMQSKRYKINLRSKRFWNAE